MKFPFSSEINLNFKDYNGTDFFCYQALMKGELYHVNSGLSKHCATPCIEVVVAKFSNMVQPFPPLA